MSSTIPWPFWIAHRGAGTLAPENTLAAFRLGAHNGWRMFECDAKLSADGIVFLLHDSTLERTTNGRGTAGDQLWADLAQLDAGSWHSRPYTGEPLPTLANVGGWCIANGYHLNIEIKPTPGSEAATGRAVAQLAQHLWRNQAIPPLLTSFAPEALAAAQQVAPELPRGLLLHQLHEHWLDSARQYACTAVVLHHVLWNAARVEQARQQGLRTLSYTVNDDTAVQRLLALRTDGIITDRVDKVSTS